MKKLFKFLLYSFIVFVFLLIAAAIAVKIYFPPEKVKTFRNQADKAVINHFNAAKVLLLSLSIDLNNIS